MRTGGDGALDCLLGWSDEGVVMCATMTRRHARQADLAASQVHRFDFAGSLGSLLGSISRPGPASMPRGDALHPAIHMHTHQDPLHHVNSEGVCFLHMGSLTFGVVSGTDKTQTATYGSDGSRLGGWTILNGPAQKTARFYLFRIKN